MRVMKAEVAVSLLVNMLEYNLLEDKTLYFSLSAVCIASTLDSSKQWLPINWFFVTQLSSALANGMPFVANPPLTWHCDELQLVSLMTKV